MRRRVVVTGMGTVNPIAKSVPDYWEALLSGKSGIAPITLFNHEAFKVHFGGEVKEWDAEQFMDGKTARRLDRFAQFAYAAADQALKDSGIKIAQEDPFRCGVIVGSGIGGISELEEQHERYLNKGGPSRISPFVVPKMIANSASGVISIQYGLMGPSTAVSTACATSNHAITDAFHTICWDLADVMISGGAEAGITPMGLGGFVSAKALSERNESPTTASRPFDRDRDGFVLSEGAGIVVLEEYEHARARGAKIYAEILGAGNTADAFHITQPHPEGLGACKSMEIALRSAKLNVDQIDYINAHGTSTQLGDIAETKAIKQTFGSHASRLAVSSTKSMIGHLLGASGGVELIATILSINHGVIHPTINLDDQDPECDLDYVPNKPRQATIRYALSNSFGFGGHNCTLAIGSI